MNILHLTGILLAGLLCACTPGPDPKTAQFQVEGMTCNSCVNAITTDLNATPGITGAQVNLDTKRADVNYDGNAITAEQIEKRIDSLGFEADLSE